MSYNKKTWIPGEIITGEALNNIENGIENLNENLMMIEDEIDNIKIKQEKINKKFKPYFGASPYFGEAKDLQGNITIYSEEVRKNLILQYSENGIQEYPIIIHVSFNETTNEFYIVEDLNIIKNVIDYGLELNVKPICIKMHAQKYKESHIDSYGHTNFYNVWLNFIDQLANEFSEYDTIEYFTVHNEVGYLYESDTHEQFVLDCLQRAKDKGYKTGVTSAGFDNFTKIKSSVIQASDAIFVNHYQAISDKVKNTTRKDGVTAWENVLGWINHIKKTYPNKPFIMSETGVQNNWYSLANPGRWDWDNIMYSSIPVEIYLYGLLNTLEESEDIERVWWWYDIVNYDRCTKLLKEFLKGE
jgi:hypothetical protein